MKVNYPRHVDAVWLAAGTANERKPRNLPIVQGIWCSYPSVLQIKTSSLAAT